MRLRACGALIARHSIVMVRHKDESRTYWTLPGGAIEPGETAAEAAAREFFEETGVHVRPVRQLFNDGQTTCYLVEPDFETPVVALELGFDPEEAHLAAEARL